MKIIKSENSLKCLLRVLALLLLIIMLAKCSRATKKELIFIPMRDGVKLATEVWFPEDDDGPWPVILIRTPYGRINSQKYGRYFSSEGYVVAIQDIRGKGGSEGTFELWVNDKIDGYDAIEWLADQEWCNGKIGMAGGSYPGWVQLAAAATKPPHLVTIVPVITPGDPSIHHIYPFGVYSLTQQIQIISLFEVKYGDGGSNYKLAKGWHKNISSLPVADLDIKLFGEENDLWRKHISHKPYDPYWQKSDVLKDLEEVDIPVYIIGGWFDFGGIGTKASYMHLKESNNGQLKLLIGPWLHQSMGKSQTMGVNFGPEAEVDLFQEELSWFDYHLKGDENGIEEAPLVRIFAVGKNEWVEADTYPVPASDTLNLFLTNAGRLINTPSSLTGTDSYSSFEYDPGNPTPPVWHDNPQEHDSILMYRDDILLFESEVFEQDIQVAGPINASLYASSSAKDTDWFVYYFLVNENDEFEALGRGLIRARYRDGKTDLLIPDNIYQYHIDLWHSSFLINKGSKIMVMICSAAFPHYSRNLNTGEDNETGSDYKIAKQKIYHSDKYPSCISLTVVK